MEATTIFCDVCGRAKGETNHWLIALTDAETPGIAFGPIDAPVADDTLNREHICGHACAMKRFSQWLESITSTERQTA